MVNCDEPSNVTRYQVSVVEVQHSVRGPAGLDGWTLFLRYVDGVIHEKKELALECGIMTYGRLHPGKE
jgi:hypothetical protein